MAKQASLAEKSTAEQAFFQQEADAQGSCDVELEQHLDWVRSVAGTLTKRMELPLEEFDELVAAGYLGLVEAAQRFDPTRGKKFIHFAATRVRGSIIDAIRKNCDLSSRGYRYAKALQAVNDSGTVSSNPDLLEEEGLNKKMALARVLDYVARGAIAFRLSLDDLTDEESQSDCPSADTILEKHQSCSIIKSLVDKLPKTERQIVKAYYYKNQSFVSIAKKHGMTKSWVSKLHKRALAQIQAGLMEQD